jgi:hypothetical protein
MSDNKFHDHLDVCERCEKQPFNLCPVGDLLIRAEVAKPFSKLAEAMSEHFKHVVNAEDPTMQQPSTVFAPGTKIVTHEQLGTTAGMLIKPCYLATRKPNAKATLGPYVPGHGGDVYFALHEDGTEAVYSVNEFELDVNPTAATEPAPAESEP